MSKRLVGNRLTSLKRKGKGAGGRGRLSDNIIDGHTAK